MAAVVAEGVRGLMDAIVGALIAAIVGGPIFYVLGTRQRRLEGLYERRAEVIAKLCELLVGVEDALLGWSNAGRMDPPVRPEQQQDFEAAYTDLNDYFRRNSIWLDRATCDGIESFKHDLFYMAFSYAYELDEEGRPRSAESREAAERLLLDVPPLKQDLESRFRAILYPKPWWEYPLRALEGIQARSRKRSGENAD